MIPAPTMAETVSEASSMVENDARSVLTPSGTWSSRTVTAVRSPRVPSPPTRAPVRS